MSHDATVVTPHTFPQNNFYQVTNLVYNSYTISIKA